MQLGIRQFFSLYLNYLPTLCRIFGMLRYVFMSYYIYKKSVRLLCHTLKRVGIGKPSSNKYADRTSRCARRLFTFVSLLLFVKSSQFFSLKSEGKRFILQYSLPFNVGKRQCRLYFETSLS